MNLRGEDGAAAVEFAIIMTVLIVVVLAILEFGREYNRYIVFQGAAREGARLAAVRAPNADVIARVYEAASPETPSSTPVVSTAGGSPECSVDTKGHSVTVSWNQEFHLDVAFWAELTLTRPISAVFRCE